LSNHLEAKDPFELVFGSAKHPLNHGFGFKVGQGEVSHEVKFLLELFPTRIPLGLRPRCKL
jgi:hypothetical protein